MAAHDPIQASQPFALALLQACNISPRNVVDVELLMEPGGIACLRVTTAVPDFVSGMLEPILQDYEIVPKQQPAASDN